MISLKRYLDSTAVRSDECDKPDAVSLLTATLDAYGSALLEMGSCSLDACPGLGEHLKTGLRELKTGLSTDMSPDALKLTDGHVQEHLRVWGRDAARHYEQKACEVKEMLLMMARTAESVGTRDQRCAGQMNAVTDRLKAIASLEDLTEIRTSIERSATELKSSIERMTEEGKEVLDHLRKQVKEYQTKLEEAEEIASRDALTGVSSRLFVESQIQKRIAVGSPLCVALIDIDGFKRVNDEHGHLTGDELLKQFAGELRSICRATDLIGRWGGDEFIFLFQAGFAEAEAQTDRLRKWVCGDYVVEQTSVQGRSAAIKVRVDASIGLTEYVAGESMKELVARADAAMYERKARVRPVGLQQPR